jgi:hypothetical protein
MSRCLCRIRYFGIAFFILVATFFYLNSSQTPQPLPVHALRFDGQSLILLDHSDTVLKRYSAKAGRPWTTPQDQALQNQGPLPEGKYWLQKQGQVSLFHSRSWRDVLGWLSRCLGWGFEGVALVPFSENLMSGRHSFFIHGGGWILGSQGCIYLGFANSEFQGIVRTLVNPVVLYVEYLPDK